MHNETNCECMWSVSQTIVSLVGNVGTQLISY